MTVPPNYGPTPEQPQTPGYGYQSPYGGQQPQYGQSSPYGQTPGTAPGSPYGSPLPPEPPRRNLGLIGGLVVGATVLLLGAVLLITMNLRGEDEDPTVASDSSSSASEEASSPEAEETTPAEAEGEVGQCLPYEPVVVGAGLELMDCGEATAFWTITGQSYDVSDVPVDDEGNLTDLTAAYELCGDDSGVDLPGEAWNTWHWVYSSGTLDSLYCIEALGNPDPESADRTPVVPDVGSCFDDSDRWWTVDCASDLALYEAVDTIVFDEPVEMSEDEAAEEGKACSSDWYFQVKDTAGRTTSLICGNDV